MREQNRNRAHTCDLKRLETPKTQCSAEAKPNRRTALRPRLQMDSVAGTVHRSQRSDTARAAQEPTPNANRLHPLESTERALSTGRL